MSKKVDPDDFGIIHYKENPDGSLDIYQDIDLTGLLNKAGFTCISFKIKSITGNITLGDDKIDSLEGLPQTMVGNLEIYNTSLATLKGCPRSVGSFICNDTKITSLEFGPEFCEKSYDCESNQIATLKFFPKIVKCNLKLSYNPIASLEEMPINTTNGGFSISHTLITSLKGCPLYIKGFFNCKNNKNLNSLEFGPTTVKGDYHCSGCNLTSLEYLPSEVSYLEARDNKLASLATFSGTIRDYIDVQRNPLVSIGLRKEQFVDTICLSLEDTLFTDLKELESLSEKIGDYSSVYKDTLKRAKVLYIKDNLK